MAHVLGRASGSSNSMSGCIASKDQAVCESGFHNTVERQQVGVAHKFGSISSSSGTCTSGCGRANRSPDCCELSNDTPVIGKLTAMLDASVRHSRCGLQASGKA